jgi:hypothetical protein
MTLTPSEWKDASEEMIDGVQRELGSAIPAKTKVALHTFRKRLDENLGARRRKQFEQELEAFIHSKPALRAAAERYLGKKIRSEVKAAIAALKLALPLLAKDKRKRLLGYSSLKRALPLVAKD